jgi:hypothetical protein
LWSESDNEVDDSLPSPLSRLFSKSRDNSAPESPTTVVVHSEAEKEVVAVASVAAGFAAAAAASPARAGYSAAIAASPVQSLHEMSVNKLQADVHFVRTKEAEQESLPASTVILEDGLKHDAINQSMLTVENGFMNKGNDTRNGTGVFLGGRLSNDAAVAFGGISPPTKGARTSSRIRLQKNADDTQMERAQKLAKAKDVVSSLCTSLTKDKGLAAGTPQPSKFSLCSISDDIIISRAEKIGVSLALHHL